MPSAPTVIDLGDLGLDEGGHVLVAAALDAVAPGGALTVHGTHPHLALHVETWCRERRHALQCEQGALVIVRGSASRDKWDGAVRADGPTVTPDATWGFAARGALVEAGAPASPADIVDPGDAWVELAPRLYAQAVASQWDPATAIAWDTPRRHPDAVEAATVQIMTYLVENELAALVVPSRFVARIHPHFREVLQLLAVQTADEARHVEVFTRRATLYGWPLGTSSVGGRASLHTLLTEPDYHLAIFLLSVLGEGSFLSLLAFIEQHAPDPVTAQIMHLTLQDEARHVAFGQAHLEHAIAADAGLRPRLRAAIERRHAALSNTTGLNADVFDALVVLAAGNWSTASIRAGWGAVQELQADMNAGRRRRLGRLGFSDDEARELAELHTRNFM